VSERRIDSLARTLLIRTAAAAAIVGLFAGAAGAQPQKEPIGRFAADARVAFPGYKAPTGVADALNVEPVNLPTRGFGLVFGAHVYPIRAGKITFGLGGELITSRRSRTPGQTQTTATTAAPAVETRFSSFAPQFSFNFGSRQGWSYISGGLGWSSFTIERTDKPLPDAASRPRTINYGGGARWFAKKHLAFAVDLRFYALSPQEAVPGRPAFPRMTIATFSAGVSVK
jgi:hypothetical protein